jgi:hypothetical protein
MKTVGKLKPRYSFLLNPYTDIRLSKCPGCQRLTHPRKFALFIHIDGWGPLILGKTCRYCTRCELIIAHRNELEAQLAHGPAALTPKPDGSGYFVVGTVDRKVWQKGLEKGTPMNTILEHMADFKEHLNLHVEGGWGPAGERRQEDG